MDDNVYYLVPKSDIQKYSVKGQGQGQGVIQIITKIIHRGENGG